MEARAEIVIDWVFYGFYHSIKGVPAMSVKEVRTFGVDDIFEAIEECEFQMVHRADYDLLLADFKAVVKKYGRTENWSELDNPPDCRVVMGDDSFKHNNGFEVAGKLARSLAAKHGIEV